MCKAGTNLEIWIMLNNNNSTSDTMNIYGFHMTPLQSLPSDISASFSNIELW